MRKSGCGPWSAGNTSFLPGVTGANPSPLSPSPAKPCASAFSGLKARTSALPSRARRETQYLALIGENLDEGRGLQPHQLENRERRRNQRSHHGDPEKLDQLQRKHM